MLKKIAYSFGAASSAIAYQSFSVFVIFFYVDVMKLPVYYAGVGMLIFAFWNAVNDPIIGFLSDNTRSHFGRRIPYLIFGALPLVIVYCLIWTPPFNGINQEVQLFAYFLAVIFIFDALYSIVNLNWAALFPEMFFSLKERASVNAFRQSLGIFGLLIGVVIPPLIYSSLGWGWMGGILGSIIFLTLFIAILGSHERPELAKDKRLRFPQALRATLENRSFMTLVLANLFIQFSFTMVLAMIPFFAKYVLAVPSVSITYILAIAFLTVIPMLFVWQKIALLFGAKKCFLSAMVVVIVALVPLLVVSEFNKILLVSSLLGAGLAGLILVVDLLIADVIDEDEIKTGERREGMFYGMNAFITRFAIGMETFCISWVFMASGYNPYVYTQPADFISGVRVLIAALPIAALLVSFLIMFLYPLAGKNLGEMKEELAVVHKGKGIIEN
ncbi:MAG: MFS transporter [bacterium]